MEPSASLDELARHPEQVVALPFIERQRVLLKLAAIQSAIASAAPDPIVVAHDELLNIDQIAAVTNLSESNLRRGGPRKFPFLRKIGGRVVGSRNDIDEWIRRKGSL